MSNDKVEHIEELISSLEEQLSASSLLSNTLETVNIQIDEMVDPNEEIDDEEGERRGGPRWTGKEKQIYSRNWELLELVKEEFPPTTKPSPDIIDKDLFQYYDSLYLCLQSKGEYFRNERDADVWLYFFLLKLDLFAGQVKAFRDQFNTFNGVGHPSREGMSIALFELLVCLFLTPAQIEKLKTTIPTYLYENLKIIANNYDQDEHGNRKHICFNESLEWLVTSVYMVNVDIISDRHDEDSNWRKIDYKGYCSTLLKLAKTETVDIGEQLQSAREQWNKKLRELQHEYIINLALKRINQPRAEEERTDTPSNSIDGNGTQLDMRVLLEQMRNIAMSF